MSNTQVINLPSSTPSVATSFETDSGTAVPAANVLQILGQGGISTSASGNTVFITDANVVSTGQTVGATNLDLITYAMPATPASVTFDVFITGMNQSGGGGDYAAGYAGTALAITDGSAATIIGTPNIDEYESAALFAGALTIQTAGNNVLFSLLGTAGETIDWSGELNLIQQLRTA